MTEAEWLTAADPPALLGAFRGRASERKWRLFVCGCCRRRTRGQLPDDRLRGLVRLTEAAADTPAGEADVRALWDAHFARGSVCAGRGHDPAERYTALYHQIAPGPHARPARIEKVVRLLSCVFGNPFRPVLADPAWLTSTVLALARGVAERRAFDRLPILADALQDAGCEDADVLGHCRGGGPHVRGCWVIDLLLGRS